MEREILFRGKRVDNDEWVEGYYNLFEIGSDSIPIIIPFQKLAKARMSDVFMYQVDLSTVGRYTGLTDRNGVRIFEGDIVEYQGKRYVIKYLKKYMRFSPSNAHTVFAVFDYTQSEIIGNIHDDPELLGGDNNA